MNPASKKRNSILAGAGIAGCLALTMVVASIGGCTKEEPPPQVQAPPPPPPPPPPPKIRSVAELMEELRIDPRVELAEDRAPQSTAERKALLEFFDAFARGNDQALSRMLDERDQRELKAMVEAGTWEEVVEDITHIEVYQTGSYENRQCVIGLFEIDYRYQPQMWYYAPRGEQYIFEAAPTPPDIMRALSGVDWIASWHKVLADERKEATIPDLAVTVPQRVLDEANDTTIGRDDGPAPAQPDGPTNPDTPAPVTPSPG